MSRPAAGFAILLALAGCGTAPEGSNQTDAHSITGAFDVGFRKGWRAKFVPACASSAREAAPTAPADFTMLCGCVADKLLASKSVTQLSTIDEKDAAPFFKQCIDETKTR